MTLEETLTAHYATAGITKNLLEGLAKIAKTPETVASTDLKEVDEFHSGGAPATEHFLVERWGGFLDFARETAQAKKYGK